MDTFETECRAVFDRHNRAGTFTWRDNDGLLQGRVHEYRERREGMVIDSMSLLARLLRRLRRPRPVVAAPTPAVLQ